MTGRRHWHRWGAPREVFRPGSWPALSPSGLRAITRGTVRVRVETCGAGCTRERVVERRPVVTQLLELPR